MSGEQLKLLNAIKEFYNQKIICDYRPDKIKNIKTGSNLEIDLYLKSHKVGFEYQGAIHFKEIRKYRNNPDKSRYNDTLKSELLESKIHDGVVIVEIFPIDLIGDIKANVIERILNTQEVLFNKRQFVKCRQLEQLYLYIKGVKNDANIKLFEKYAILNNNRFNTIKERISFINQLVLFRSRITFFNEFRKVFDLEMASKLLHFDRFLSRKIN